jgi:hypothetical protein
MHNRWLKIAVFALAMLLLGGGTLWVCWLSPRQRAIARIQSLGGSVMVDVGESGGPVTSVAFIARPLTNDDLRALIESGTFDALGGVNRLFLDNTKITDDALGCLQAVSHLDWLQLCGCNITDEGLPRLQQLKALHTLRLSRTRITDQGLKQLGKLHQLHLLDLQGCVLSDAAVLSFELSRPDMSVFGPNPKPGDD